MIISPLTPLYFGEHKTDGLESGYIQLFSSSDRILVQLIRGREEAAPRWILYQEPGHIFFSDILFNSWNVNNDTVVDFAVISPSRSIYTLEIGGMVSKPFRVTDDECELANTTLIQYSMHNNRQRDDTLFFIDNMQYFFDFRAPGGFKDSNWTFGVENEQFTTDRADIMELYAFDSIQQKFTLGTSQGCPVWFAALLNRLLCCTYVYFDGVRYARKDANVPEMNVQLEGVNSFVFTQSLQRVNNLNPTIEQRNQAIMRRINSKQYRSVAPNINRIIL